MLHILLLILKIIGIVLLVVMGALLLGIACALFVPVRYRIEAVRQEGEGQPPAAVRVKVTWLLHLINLLFRFDGTAFVRARILIFTVFQMPKKERRRRKAKEGKRGGKKKKRREPEKQEKQGNQAKEEETALPGDELEGGQETAAAAETALKGGEMQKIGGSDEDITQSLPEDEKRGQDKEQKETEETQEGPGLMDKLRAIPEILRNLFEKIKGIFENIEYTINRFCDKIRSISDTIEYYREVVEGEPFKRSFALCKGELLNIVKTLKPRKFEASLIIGMDDPAATGEILAICGMLYPVIGGHVDVRGDFERKRLEGEILIVGKLRMVTFLRTAVKIYFNKDIRKLYRLLKRRQ